MKNTSRPYSLELYCKCGFKLVRYTKGGGRRLVKVHKDRVINDFAGFVNDLPENSDLHCPSCGIRVATVKKVNGKFVNKLNQGAVGKIK